MWFIPMSLILACGSLSSALAQEEGKIAVVSERVGEVINLNERNYFNMFLATKEFQSAIFLQQQDSTFVVRITYVDEGISKARFRKVSEKEFLKIREYLDHFEEIERGTYSITSKPEKIEIMTEEELRIGMEKKNLEKVVSKISRKGMMTVVRNDGSKIRGSLVSIDLDQFLLTMNQLNGESLTSPTYHISEIKKIQYRQSGKLNKYTPAYMMIGFFVGATLGGIIGHEIAPGGGSFIGGSTEGGPVGLAIGAGGGLILGAFISLVIPVTYTIEFR